MFHPVIAFAGAVALVIAGGSAHLNAHAQDPLPGCSLAIDESGGLVHARAVIESASPMQGSYEMTLARQSRGGTVDLSQSGAFSVAAGERAVLNEATLNGRARDLRAGLTMKTGGRTLRCPVLVNGHLQEEI